MSLRGRVLASLIAFVALVTFDAAPLCAEEPAAAEPLAAPDERGRSVGDANADDADSKRGEMKIETIVVVAEKRAESAQELPIAISAFSQSDLQQAGAEGLIGLQQLTPSLQMGTTGMEFYVTLRGIGGELASIGSEAGVTISQDGVPIALQYMFDADFFDTERVEVLRGPQGTINGRNATGGAVNVYSKQPTEEFEGGVEATLGNYHRYAIGGYLSGEIVDGRLLGRLAFKTDNADGWLENTFLNEDQLERRKNHFRASLLSDVTENLEALFVLDGVHDRSGPPNLLSYGRIRPDTPSFGEFAGVPEVDADSLEVEGDTKTFGEKDQYRASLKLSWDITPSTTLTATTGYMNADIESAYDCDGTRIQACTVKPYEFDLWQVSQELTLAADLTERLDLIFGALYLHTDYAQLTEFFSTAYIGLPPDVLVVEALQTLDSYAVYGQVRYRIADDWKISLGARYTRDQKTYEEDAKAVVVLNPGDFDDDWGAFTPRFAVDYTPTEDLTLFASISRGFKAGGFNTYQVPQEAFNPEYVWSYEVGAKALLLDGRVRTAGSAFFMDYTDLQQNVYGFSPGSFTPQTINAGKSEIVGVELEADGLVTEQLRLGFTATWLDAVFTKLRTADPIFPELGTPDPDTGLNVRNLSGNRLARAPEWQFTVSSEYSRPLTGELTGVLRADYSRRGDHFFTLYNYDLEKQEAYGVLNLYAAIEGSDGKWTLSGFVRNALDERYVLNRQLQTVGLAPVPMNRAVFGEPRMYGMTLAYNF